MGSIVCEGSSNYFLSCFDCRVWDVASGTCTAVAEEHTKAVRSLAINGDYLLASGADDNLIKYVNFLQSSAF
jgi:WD40 repeat protein